MRARRARAGGCQRLERRAHPLAREFEFASKPRAVAEAQAAREPFELFAVAGQQVRLYAGRPLHPVLDPAQEHVRFGDPLCFAIAHQPLTSEPCKRRQGALNAQRLLASAPHQLQRLYEELGLPDTTAAELQVTLRV